MRSVGIHMCRGNFSGRHLANGGYEWVAERFFARADANHFLLEYDTPRAGDFAPLRFVPKGKGVVLGLISSKTPVLETIDSLQRRVDEATKYIAPERLAISPQCGFASSAGGNPLTETDERTKLRLAVNAARDLAIADEHPPYALGLSCIFKALVVLPTNCPTTAVKELCDHRMIAAAEAGSGVQQPCGDLKPQPSRTRDG